MTNKKRGTDYETKAVHELRALPEAIEVRRTPASLGVFDIWALMDDGLHLIQVKSTKYQERFEPLKHQIKDLRLPYYCIKELWIWYSYRSKRLNKNKPNLKGWLKYVL